MIIKIQINKTDYIKCNCYKYFCTAQINVISKQSVYHYI